MANNVKTRYNAHACKLSVHKLGILGCKSPEEVGGRQAGGRWWQVAVSSECVCKNHSDMHYERERQRRHAHTYTYTASHDY